MQARTKRQKEVFEYIKHYIEQYGSEPSYQMIARHLGVSSKAGIARHIKALEAQGLIKRQRENGSFWLDLRREKSISDAVCEIEWIAFSQAADFGEKWEKESLFVPRFLIGKYQPEDLRAFRLIDDGMRDRHLCEGDVALVEERAYARDGSVVVALLEKKRVVFSQFFRLGANVELRFANEDYQAIKIPANNIEIVGVYRGLLRPII